MRLASAGFHGPRGASPGGSAWGLRGGSVGSPRGLRASFRGVSVGSPGVSGGLRVWNEFGRLASTLTGCIDEVIQNSCVFTIKMVTHDANQMGLPAVVRLLRLLKNAVVQPPFKILKREGEWLINV